MKTSYIDLIDQTYTFPQEEFTIHDYQLRFHDIPLQNLIKEYGTPLKFTYLPQISNNIQRAKQWFQNAIDNTSYKGKYHYCYCTKSAHFKYILDEALKNDIHIETSSAFDIDIVKRLKEEGKITSKTAVLCNGFKRDEYINNIAELINDGHQNCIPIIDNYEEVDLLEDKIDNAFTIGIRIASDEEPSSEFYTSRLGIEDKKILEFYEAKIKSNDNVSLKMLHFFINTGIRDTSYYWSEFHKCLNLYIALKKSCPSLDSLNIGGGFPIKDALDFDFDYQQIVHEIVNQIHIACTKANVKSPDIYTEFGSFTVGESSGSIYEVLYQKQQNDKEKWNIINASFITTLPDTWALSKRFVMLPINQWHKEYEAVLLGGLTCDSDDYYISKQHQNTVYLPKFNAKEPLYIGFFNTGAYQETIGGYGGLQHCLIPQPKRILIDKNKEGKLITKVFAPQQTANDFLTILGYHDD